MTRFYKSILLFFILGMFCPSAFSQTGRWVVMPLFETISEYSDGLYKVKHKNKWSIADRDGRYLVGNADSITPLVDGKALVLATASDGRYRLTGIFDEKAHAVSKISEEIYAGQYPFFSEGLMPVLNKDGKAGYINESGQLVIPFKYANAHPFSNGYAAVTKGKGGLFAKMAKAVGAGSLIGKDKVYYINPIEGELKISKDVGDIYFGSTFKDGEALVVNKAKQFCFIDNEGKLKRIEPSVTLEFDDMFRLGKDEPVANGNKRKQVADQGMGIYEANGKLGYTKNGKIIIPAQFAHAGEFRNGRAIASDGEYFGVVELLDENIDVKMSKAKENRSTEPDSETVDVDIIMPRGYGDDDIEVISIDKEGYLFSRSPEKGNRNGRYQLSMNMPKTGRSVKVYANLMEVWNSEMTKTSKASSNPAVGGSLEFKFSANKAKANSKDIAVITITIENNSDNEISGDVELTGAAPYPKSVTIPARGKADVKANFYNVKKDEVRTVTITLNGEKSSKKITLQPFFNF